MKRTLAILAATSLMAVGHSQIGWRDLRMEGEWRAMAQDGSNAEAVLMLGPNGRFQVEVRSPNRGEISAWGSYFVNVESIGVLPNAQVLYLRFERWAISGDMRTPPRTMKLAAFLDSDWPLLSDGNGTDFYRSSYRRPAVTVWTPPYRR